MKPDHVTTDSGTCPAELLAPCPVCPLHDLTDGRRARVVDLSCPHGTRRRLMALGVCPSAEVCVLGRAPNRGALVVRAGTVRLMLREHEAATIHVRPEPIGAGQP